MFFFFRYYCYFYSVIFSVNLITLLRASFITFYLQTSCLIQIKCMNRWTSLCSATMYADNVTLPAFTAAAVRRAAIDRYLLPAASAAKLWPMLRQTDGQFTSVWTAAHHHTVSIAALHPGLQCWHAPASAFRQPSPTCRTAFPAQHLRPSGVLSCWPDGLELTPGFSSALGVLNDYTLYKSTQSLNHSLRLLATPSA